MPCFLVGTRIATPRGDVSVEDLREGDLVLTVAGADKPIVWIGRATVDCRTHAKPEEVIPVRIGAGAFAEGVPARDLLLSPGHAIFAAGEVLASESAGRPGVLIPIGRLVNGVSIGHEERAAEVTYYHLELPAHDVLLAEGLPAESHLDDGDHDGSANARPEPRSADAARVLDPGYVPQARANACAPMHESGPEVAGVKQRLRSRLEAMGWRLQSGGGIEVWAGGIRLEPRYVRGGLHHFMLPARAEEVRLVSPRGVPSGLIDDSVDSRLLGAQLALVLLDGEWIPLDSPMLVEGFYGVERDASGMWRWTNGSGTLRLPPGKKPRLLELFVRDVMRHWTTVASDVALPGLSRPERSASESVLDRRG